MPITTQRASSLPTDALCRLLREQPDNDVLFDELCRRGDDGIAIGIRIGEAEDRAIERANLPPATRAAVDGERVLERLPSDQLTTVAQRIDRDLGSSDKSVGGFA